MFEDLRKKTVEILSNRASKLLFDTDSNDDDEDDDIGGPFLVKKIHNFIYEQERSASEIENDDRVQSLQRCMAKLQVLHDHQAKCSKVLGDLKQNYESVAEKTTSLHTACDQMMSQQTQLAAANEQIKSNLHHYQQYDWIMKKLQTSKLSLTGTLFTQILSTINECITYLKAHSDEKEAELYLSKYEQCLSKSLTAIKVGVLSDLEACKEDVFYRQSRMLHAEQPDGAAGERNPIASYVNDDTFALLYGVFGVKANTVKNAISQAHRFFADYPEYQTVVLECEQEYFAIREQLLHPIVSATIQHLCERFRDSSCNLTRDGCSFLLRLCDDEFRLYKQFFVIDPTSDGTTSGTRSVATPAANKASSLFWPELEYFWRESSLSFDTFIEGLCTILYDTLRPLIIANPHLETLTQLCTLIKVEMIEERCGRFMPTPPLSASSDVNPSMTGLTNMNAEFVMNPRAGFARVMGELVGDIVERIVYRTSLFAQSDVLDYNPAPGDLAYPERLLMMKDIRSGTLAPSTRDPPPLEFAAPPAEPAAGNVVAATKRKSSSSGSSAIDLHCLWYPTVRRTVMCLSKLYKCLDPTVFLNVSGELLESCCRSLELAAEKIRVLPIDPSKATMRSAGRQLDAELFIVKHLLILREQTSPYRSASARKRRGMMAAMAQRSDSVGSAGSGGGSGLNLLDVQQQFDYTLDLSKYKNSMSQLLSAENRGRWFELSSNNAFLSFLLSAPVHVSEFQTDSRRIIEGYLKKYCHNLIRFVTGLLAADFIRLVEEIDAFERQCELQQSQCQVTADSGSSDGSGGVSNEKPLAEPLAPSGNLSPKAINDSASIVFRNVKQNWPIVRGAFSLYIGSRETEEILLQPIRKAIINLFTNVNVFTQKHFNEEQRQIASVPQQEQIWLLLNSGN